MSNAPVISSDPRRLSRSFGLGDLLNPAVQQGDRSSSSVSAHPSDDDSPAAVNAPRKDSAGDLRLPSLSSPLTAAPLPPPPPPFLHGSRAPSNLGPGHADTRHASLSAPRPFVPVVSTPAMPTYPELHTRHSISTLPRAPPDLPPPPLYFTPYGAGQRPYRQMMTLDTQQGPVQVPVDVQAASKVADEKRRRNATASHRFRQRRKEKEQETSSTIARLETQLRDTQHAADFYRRERDFLQDLLLRNHIALPPRPSSPSAAEHLSSSPEPDTNARPSLRRRTSAYQPVRAAPTEPLPEMPWPRDRAETFSPRSQPAPAGGPFHPHANPFDPRAPR